MNKIWRDICLFAVSAGLVFSLAGCKNDTQILPDQGTLGDAVATDPTGGGGNNATAPTPSFGDDQSGTGSDLTFDLDQPSQPSFDNIPLVRDDSQPTTLYAMDGDYAYALDPDTMQPTGGPLDPVTHEPVTIADEPSDDQSVEELTEGEPPVVEGDQFLVEGDDTPTDEDPVVVEDPPVVSEPDPYVNPEVKLPNTGIFLEDD